MPELRKDPVIGRWVIISEERSRRPIVFRPHEEKKQDGFCPFCPGNERFTPPEIFALRTADSAPNTPGWQLRVIPNKFPALRVEGSLNRRGEGIYDWMNGVGAHEVVVETSDHHQQLAELDLNAFQRVLAVYRDRMLDLKKDIRFKHIIVFKNHGAAAGASLDHSHSQLIATPIIPKLIHEELSGSREYYHFKERCIYCDIVHQEIKDDVRVVYEEEYYLAIEPYAPRFPFETWILPKYHASHFETIDEERLRHLAVTLKTVLHKINRALQSPAYNFVLHTAPVQQTALEHYHWHLELMPKVTHVAGFEWGTGFYINATSPEEAARFLKEIQD